MKGVQTGMLLHGIKLLVIEHKKLKDQGENANLSGMRQSLYLLTELVKDYSPTVYDKNEWLQDIYKVCKPPKS